MARTDVRSADSVQPRTFSRRTAFRLAGIAAPVGAAIIWPRVSSNAASPTAPVIQIIDAVSRRIDTFKLGTTRPDATNTGIPDGTKLTVYTGSATLTTPNMTYQNMVFNSYIALKPTASGVTFSNCLFQGPSTPAPGQSALLSSYAGVTNVTVDRCTFKPRAPNYWVNGIYGWGGMTINRCDISNVVDGIDPFGGTYYVYGNYVHDFATYSPSPSNSDSHTHNDGMQFQGGSGSKVIGNNFQGFADPRISHDSMGWNGPQGQITACFTIVPVVSTISNLTITDNWLDGGMYTLNVVNYPSGADRPITNLGVVERNRFGRQQGVQGPGGDLTYTMVICKGASSSTGNGTSNQNVYADNSHPVYVRN